MHWRKARGENGPGRRAGEYVQLRARRRLLVATLGAVGCASCATDALSTTCPDLQEGDLVITELRGPQTSDDSYGEWIELLNAGDTAVALVGVRVEFQPISGRDPSTFFVRNEEVTVEARDYVVLGRRPDTSLPQYLDYGYVIEGADASLPTGGARISVFACDRLVDEFIYFESDLPDNGTFALDGALTPAADDNNRGAFCVDDTAAPAGALGIGLPGTPGEANPPC